MSFTSEPGEPESTALRTPAGMKRLLLAAAAVGCLTAAALFVAWAWLHGTSAVTSPFLWGAVAGFWSAAFCLLYWFEIGAMQRALRALGAVELDGVRVFWLPEPDPMLVGASMELVARSSDPRYPPQFSLLVNLDLLWAVHVKGVRASWECKESGVLLLTPRAPRFLEGATADSLSLPSVELSALKGFLRPPHEPEGLPGWGTPAGPLAKEALASVNAADWLIVPEQPFLALEAFEGRIGKVWPPIADRLVLLDVEAALDLLEIVRAFDRDALNARRARLTSSPSSPRP